MPRTIIGTNQTKLWQNYPWRNEVLGRVSVRRFISFQASLSRASEFRCEFGWPRARGGYLGGVAPTRCMPIKYMTLRRMPMRHTHEMHARRMHAYEAHAYAMHAREE